MLKIAQFDGRMEEQYGTMVIRHNGWLAEHCLDLWERYFSEVPVANPVQVAFGQAWRNRLGLIMLDEASKISCIRLNALLSLDVAPEVVATVTLAHEMVHYSHGFGSTLPRFSRYPHRGGVVDRELRRRGFGQQLEPYRKWIDDCWFICHNSYHRMFT